MPLRPHRSLRPELASRRELGMGHSRQNGVDCDGRRGNASCYRLSKQGSLRRDSGLREVLRATLLLGRMLTSSDGTAMQDTVPDCRSATEENGVRAEPWSCQLEAEEHYRKLTVAECKLPLEE